VPLGLKRWFAARGIAQVQERDWWQSATVGAATVTVLPAQHFSGRGPFDRNATLWCSQLLEVGGTQVFFAGDTGYSPEFSEIGAAFPGIDLALLPIGAYNPRWFMRSVHIDPAEAVQIFRDLGAHQAAAMHWGTFRLTLEPLNEPPQKLREAMAVAGLPEERFWVLQHGETRGLEALLQP
jgi:N-acyl-phosphatidylethanolamine-hydrolysing phospholipase D